MKEFHVINLGAGVQSTAFFMMVHMKMIPMPADTVCIFADTQDEEDGTYAHLEYLRSLEWPRIHVRTAGKLSDDLVAGRGAGSKRKYQWVSIPAFSKGNERGIILRQCTSNYKIRVIEQFIRRDLIGLAPGRAIPKDVEVYNYIGISLDEARRALGAKERIESRRGWFAKFPFLEMDIDGRIGRSRGELDLFNRVHVPHRVPRSACKMCPLRSDREWLDMKSARPAAFAEAVRIDHALRPSEATNRKLDKELFLHRSCVPLEHANFNANQGTMAFTTNECTGMCGV